MRSPVPFLAFACTLVLAAGCSDASVELLDPGFQPATNPALPARDEAAAAAFPSGSFAVRTEVFVGRGSLPAWNVDGYVEFASTGACAMDLTMTQADGLFRDSYDSQTYEEYVAENPLAPLPFRAEVPKLSPLLGFPALQELRQPLGGLAWARTSAASFLGVSPHAGTWIDAHDPWFPLLDLVPLLPSTMLTSNLPAAAPLAGTGPSWCSVPLLAYVAVATARADGGVSLRFDRAKFCALERASLQAGLALQLAAYDPDESGRILLHNAAAGRAQSCGFDLLSSATRTMEVSPTVDGFVVSASHESGFPLFRAVFTRTAARVVSAPDLSGFLDVVVARRAAGIEFLELYEMSPAQLRSAPRD